ncbi:phage shock protein A, PspA [Scytonema sp. HK-05]|uniref:PspA/IM30 family protein n=1 Tax=Scytonema sp. HK-05 TaxID=1137095 RepID=UPI000AFAB66A|nr:phage shock protein A, PspA [Scytonema sp. HK-05]
MGELFHRISRLVKAELNHVNREIDIDKYKDATATAFAVAGGIAGASIGKIGILAKGAGFSVGAVPLTAAGALTGLGLYEAIRAVVEGDASSAGAAAIGAAAGASVSAAIGGVGVAVGGTAFGVGMASMAAAGSVAGLGIAALNQLLQQGTDPEKLLDLAVEDMQEDLLKFRQAVIPVIAAKKRTLQHYEQAQAEEKKWQRRALLAVQKGDDNLARQALERKKIFAENANTLKVHLDEQTALVDSLQTKLFAFETKVSEAKTKAAGSVAGLGIAALNQLLQQGTDPEKLLDLAVEDMQEDLLKFRQAVIPVIAAKKRTLQHYEQAQAEEKKWQRRALLAVQKGDDNLARQALERKKIFAENANTLKVHLDEQTALVDSLQSKLFAFETKVSEAKAKKVMLKARIAAAKAEAQLQSTVGRLGSSSAMAAFERMEEKVLLQEAHTQSVAELASANLESQFAALESSGDIDDELAALKEQMALGLPTSVQQAQPCE